MTEERIEELEAQLEKERKANQRLLLLLQRFRERTELFKDELEWLVGVHNVKEAEHDD